MGARTARKSADEVVKGGGEGGYKEDWEGKRELLGANMKAYRFGPKIIDFRRNSFVCSLLSNLAVVVPHINSRRFRIVHP